MLTIPTSLRVFAHRFATDMGKSFHGLVGIIESELRQQFESGTPCSCSLIVVGTESRFSSSRAMDS